MPDVRVLHDGSWHHPGGGAAVAKELAKALDAPVTVGHCAQPEYWTAEPEIDAEIAFQDELHNGFSGRLPQPALELRLGMLFRSLALDADIIVSSGTAAKWIVPEVGQHHVHYCHVPPPRFYGEGQGTRSPIKWGLRQFGGMTDQYFASFVDDWLANSEWTQQRVQAHYHSEAAVLNPPVRTSQFQPLPPSRAPYFVMVGRLVDMKRPDIVAQAFDEGLGAELVLIGDGPLREECESADHVSVYPAVDNRGVELAVGRAIGGIAFASGEHAGITPKEIQAAGKPVIVPDEPNLHNHVVDGETGVIVPSTVAGVKQGVRRVLASEWNAERLQQVAASWSVDSFHERARRLILGQEPERSRTEPEPAVADGGPTND